MRKVDRLTETSFIYSEGREITFHNHLKSHLITWTEFIAIIKYVHYVFHSTQKHQ